MKLSEALSIRADLQKRIAQLRELDLKIQSLNWAVELD
jgi:hypothetical protein